MPYQIEKMVIHSVGQTNIIQLYIRFFLVALIMINFTSTAMAAWETQWIDKFDGTAVNWNNWTAQTQANYNNEVQCYTDDDSSAEQNFEVSNGSLKIIARRQTISCPGLGGQQKSWTSGRINSKDKAEYLYGRIESRIRFLDLKGGTWPAFWMLENRIHEQPIANDNDFANWPNPGAGEIDVWEWFSNNATSYITNFFNTGGCGYEVRYSYPGGGTDVQQWHKYAIEWDANRIAFYIDNIMVTEHDVSNCAQYKEPMYVLLNVAMGGNLGGSIDPTLNLATMEVDYVAHCIPSDTSLSSYCDESTASGESGVAIPVISSTAKTTATTNELYSYTLIATDPDSPTLIYSASNLPYWLNFIAATAELRGTPAASNIGVYPVTLSVSDGITTVSQSFSITVSAPANNSPTITSTTINSQAYTGELYSYTLTATDQDADALSMSATIIPAWLTFNASSGLLSGTPTANDIGSHSVSLLVTDGIDDINQKFTINVAARNTNTETSSSGGGGGSSYVMILLLLINLKFRQYFAKTKQKDN